MKVEPFGVESGKEEKQGVRAQVVASASTHTQAEVLESWEGVGQAEVTARRTGMCALTLTQDSENSLWEVPASVSECQQEGLGPWGLHRAWVVCAMERTGTAPCLWVTAGSS